ncbi:glycosyltransferase [Photorhabdus cinerea]|uniref:Glycosyltransferase 2-like domain-containing protein n=1 Tax=Photorhabdus cinerea TaxID=471575 RepID=A0A7X5QCZ5_9GAMM|nr:glycosyltransferase [Photorhabdus cinerea]NHB92020.1 hypothetical protein [Photorhabdus cinerea]
METIDIAISTLGNRIKDLEIPNYKHGFHYIIVHQYISNLNNEAINRINKIIDREDVLYIKHTQLGLTKSRNIAIKQSESDYIFIMDDDVSYDLEKMKLLVEHMKKDNVSVGTFYHKYTNGLSTLKSKGIIRHNKYNIGNPSSIDICLRRSDIIEHNILFDENFGLGTSLPSGEEMIFLSDCLDKNLNLIRYPIEICTHSPITSGIDFYSSVPKIRAKREMIKRVFRKKYYFISLLFVIKKFKYAYKAGYGVNFIKYMLLP